MTDAVITKIITFPYFYEGVWFVDVAYEAPHYEGKTTLPFEDYLSALITKPGDLLKL